uniref:C2H2-type domain-containing protein n=1 Tax=Branchiostoma floridae TaxID=7739 RepID=C3YG51_BRAFL|eukprot:XP_002604846.1 hypothetical protein BRAFLDRAFT_70699 [Branchiostoma floridae]
MVRPARGMGAPAGIAHRILEALKLPHHDKVAVRGEDHLCAHVVNHCKVCDREFDRAFNLDRHLERKHRYKSGVASGEVVVDAETGSYRECDVFDDSDVSSEQDTDTVGSEDGDSMASQDEESVSDAESVMGSEQGDSTEETDSDQSGSESDTGTDVSSGTVSSDESERTGYDSGYHSGDKEEWTLYRDWSIALPHQPGDFPQRVIKQTKRAGKNYLIEFAALPRYSNEVVHSKNWVLQQTLMKKYVYLVLK